MDMAPHVVYGFTLLQRLYGFLLQPTPALSFEGAEGTYFPLDLTPPKGNSLQSGLRSRILLWSALFEVHFNLPLQAEWVGVKLVGLEGFPLKPAQTDSPRTNPYHPWDSAQVVKKVRFIGDKTAAQILSFRRREARYGRCGIAPLVGKQHLLGIGDGGRVDVGHGHASLEWNQIAECKGCPAKQNRCFEQPKGCIFNHLAQYWLELHHAKCF